MPAPLIHDATTARRTDGRSGVVALFGAIVFVGCYFAMDFVRGAVATQEMPLPNAPADQIYHYLVSDSAAVAAAAVCMLLSVTGLFTFLRASRKTSGPVADSRQRWGHRAGLAAVAAMLLSIVLNLVLSAVASSLTIGTAALLNTSQFIAGGTAHVAFLGAFVWLTSRSYKSRGIRVLAIVAAVPSVLSLISLAWFYGAALILLGRLLCMVWTLVAGVALVRAQRRSLPVAEPR